MQAKSKFKIQSKARAGKNSYLLITVSDKQGTRHFKIPKYLKSVLIGVSSVMVFALVASNTLFFMQKSELDESRLQTNSMEDAFVKLSAKNSSLNKTIVLSNAEKQRMSKVVARMEQLSGVSTSMSAPILDRLTAISGYFTDRQPDFDELNNLDNLVEEDSPHTSVPLTTNADSDTPAAEVPVEDQIDLVSLDINQQKILHDSIPNGYPNRNIGISSAFGERTHPTTNETSFHNGIDLKAAEGTQVYATADGIIKQADYHQQSGKRIIITHNYGFETRYAHLSEMRVKPGDVIQKGDIIGLSGKTGRSDGAYLHYEVRHIDKAHNPIDFLTWEYGNQEIFTKVRGIQWQSLISLINKQVSRPTLQLSQLAPE